LIDSNYSNKAIVFSSCGPGTPTRQTAEIRQVCAQVLSDATNIPVVYSKSTPIREEARVSEPLPVSTIDSSVVFSSVKVSQPLFSSIAGVFYFQVAHYALHSDKSFGSDFIYESIGDLNFNP